MHKFLDWMNERPRLVKILFCLPIIDIIWAFYRIAGALANKNFWHFVLALIWVIFGSFVGWILDLIWILLFNHIFWFEE